MTADEIKAALARAAKAAWPDAARASDLPFPDYWRRQTEYLAFHAPHVGDRLMDSLIAEAVAMAREAERNGTEPVAWVVPDRVRRIWDQADIGRAQLGHQHSLGGESAQLGHHHCGAADAGHFSVPFSGGSGIRYRPGRVDGPVGGRAAKGCAAIQGNLL